MEQALSMFKRVQEILGEDQDTVLVLPCKALLQQLPAHLRGPAWNAQAFPDAKLDVPRDAVLAQLKKGQIQFLLRDFLPVLPPDWVKAEPTALVNLDLAMVVEAIPLQWFKAALPAAHAADGVKHIPDYFKPATPVARPSAPPAPVATEPAAVEPAVAAAAQPPPPPPPVAPPRVLRPGEWNGVEIGPDAGAHVVDINHTDLKGLLTLPGIGRLRAEAILKYRQEHERFQSIFELAEVPGVGRKLFKQITGLTMRRRDRHEVLCALLGLEKTARPTLAQLAGQLCAQTPVTGSVFSNRDGMPLASAGLTEAEAASYAAIVPQLFRRARRYLKTLDPQPLHTLVLPVGEKPVVLMQAREFFLILALAPGAALDPLLQRIAGLARELDWLQGQRAIVTP
jgi:competence ComEA-like helix-hairpin-helix protein